MARRRTSPLITDALNAIALRFVGDGNFLNYYFVTDRRHVVMITDDYDAALLRWQAIARKTPMQESAMADRLTGVIACVEPDGDSTTVLRYIRRDPDPKRRK